ncbi:NusG domain II-containing protein [Miniphocaeibacter massiliensis]|uniref:NusG domain II-containing protein n=1 Tax=Miniphocaeibacter massiliensis TaxID=2041841 RepID=UPI000C1BE19B|nr:NusG domain II-containing protein [Miniphocaeibacter massiliensis]
MKKIITKGDKIVIIAIVIIAILLFFKIQKSNFDSENKYISIQVDSKEIKKILIDSNTNGRYPIETKFGKNVIEIRNGKIHVIEASCPDKLDVKQGYIENMGEMIVCIPNRLIIQIKNNEKNTELDAINY